MKILVADDDIVSRTMVVMILQKSGLEVVSCENGQEALDHLTGPNAPRLAILDWMMPKLDGPDVIRAVRSQLVAHPYLILLSNRSETADKVAGLESGADDYLSKPVSATELKARIHVGQRYIELQDQLATQSRALLLMERQQRALSLAQMAGGVAHHLNNKLQAVIGCLDLMLIDQPQTTEDERGMRGMLCRARDAAEEAAEIGKKMLAYLSQNRGKPEPVLLESACRAAVSELLPQFPVLQDMVIPAPAPSLAVYFNAKEIHEILLQLLKNALEANPQCAPRIRFDQVMNPDCLQQKPPDPHVASNEGMVEQGPFIRMTLHDSGPGIPGDKIGQIFEPFMTTKFTGRGMGLPVCQGIVKKAGGGILVSCPKEGGTRVVLCLPEHAPEKPGA